jgi:hypothetical protein
MREVKEDHINGFIEKMNQLALQDYITYIDGDGESGPMVNPHPFEEMKPEDFRIGFISMVNTDQWNTKITHWLDDGDGFWFTLTGFYHEGGLELVVQASSEGVCIFPSGELAHNEAQGKEIELEKAMEKRAREEKRQQRQELEENIAAEVENNK